MVHSTADAEPSEAGADEGSELEAFGYRQELKRSLSLVDLLVYGLVFISPTAPWAVFGFVYNASKGMAPLIYALGLGAMVFTAISYSTMARAFPVAGSVYAYAARGIGQSAGFLAGWAILLDYLLIPSLCYVFCAAAVHAIAPDVPKAALVVALLVGITVVNLAGVQAAAGMNKLILLVQLVVLAAFVALALIGLAHGTNGAHLSWAPLLQPSKVTPGLLFGALSLAALSFLGFDAISTMAEEAKGGASAVGVATILSLVLSASLFMLQTYLASLFVLGRSSFSPGSDTDAAFLHIAQAIGGPLMEISASLFGIALACVAGALVGQGAAARLIYGMSRDRQLPTWLGHIHGKRKTPDRAVLLIAALTMAISLTMLDRLETLTSVVNFGALTGFLMLHASVLIHFGLKPGRKWLPHVAVPIIGFAVIAYVLINTDITAKIAGFAWLSVGVAVLLWLKWKGRPLALPDEG